jgi:hypothetical protein
VGNDDDAVVRHHAAEERTRLARDGKTGTTLIRACTNGNAWTVLAAATLVQACGGLAYSFAVYAQVGSTATSSVNAWGSLSISHFQPFSVYSLGPTLPPPHAATVPCPARCPPSETSRPQPIEHTSPPPPSQRVGSKSPPPLRLHLCLPRILAVAFASKFNCYVLLVAGQTLLEGPPNHLPETIRRGLARSHEGRWRELWRRCRCAVRLRGQGFVSTSHRPLRPTSRISLRELPILCYIFLLTSVVLLKEP